MGEYETELKEQRWECIGLNIVRIGQVPVVVNTGIGL